MSDQLITEPIGRGRYSLAMCDLRRGDVWETAGGKRLDILDRAFIWSGKRWVVVFDRDFHVPRVISLADLEAMRMRKL